MAYKNKLNYLAVSGGGAGNPRAWKIISDTDYALGNKKVAAFMNITVTEDGETPVATLTSVKEEVKEGDNVNPPVIETKGEKYLAYEYPFGIPFEGRFTELIPATGFKFKVWFLL